MRIIDAHAHITSSWEELGIVRDVDDSIRLMDRYDIEISFSSDSRALRGDYVAANDRLLDAMARFPGRICGYAVANPWDGQAGLDHREFFSRHTVNFTPLATAAIAGLRVAVPSGPARSADSGRGRAPNGSGRRSK